MIYTSFVIEKNTKLQKKAGTEKNFFQNVDENDILCDAELSSHQEYAIHMTCTSFLT